MWVKRLLAANYTKDEHDFVQCGLLINGLDHQDACDGLSIYGIGSWLARQEGPDLGEYW